MKVLVTGADGFIGSHLVEVLISKGYEVRAFIYYNSFNSWGWLDTVPQTIKDSIDIFAGDVRDPHGVDVAMRGCDAVLHLAALIGIPYSYHSPSAYVDTNITGTLNILQAARSHEVSKVVHTSTSEVYGTAQFIPITEEHPVVGQSPYSATKIGADQLALSFFRSFDMPVTVIRPFNTYGPRQSARAVIPTIISQIAQKSESLVLGSLDPTRDFNFVKDTVSGFISLLESESVIGECVNIGNGYDLSIGKLAQEIANLMNSDITITQDDARVRPEASEVERLLADNSKALSLSGWKPEYKGLDGLRKGLMETIEWMSVPENLSTYKSHLYNV